MKTYGILKQVADNTISNAETNMYDATGKHKKSIWVRKYDSYILFEKTINTDGTEFYSNAWSSSDYQYIKAKAERFNSFYNYIDKVGKEFSGAEIQLI